MIRKASTKALRGELAHTIPQELDRILPICSRFILIGTQASYRTVKYWMFIFSLGLLWGMCLAPVCASYAVLTHEAIIDAAWKDNIVPLLLKRFPNATPDELLQ